MSDLDRIRADRKALDARFQKIREQAGTLIGMFRIDVHRPAADTADDRLAAQIAAACGLHDAQLDVQVRMLSKLRSDAEDLEEEYRWLLSRTEELQDTVSARIAALLEHTKEGLQMSILQLQQQRILLENEIRMREELRHSFGQAEDAARTLDDTMRRGLEERFRKKLDEFSE